MIKMIILIIGMIILIIGIIGVGFLMAKMPILMGKDDDSWFVAYPSRHKANHETSAIILTH